MTTRAPGKLVLSGAYAVLRGAPAIVTAVSRFAQANGELAPSFESAEVTCLLKLLRAEGILSSDAAHPHFNADALRGTGGQRKLGLGSSAAIVAASLPEVIRTAGLSPLPPQRQLQLCLEAHREAQGGGSGIDVAAAVLGGTLLARKSDSGLEVTPVSLFSNLVWEVWGMPTSASTAEFVKKIFAAEQRLPDDFAAAFGHQFEASQAAASCLKDADSEGFVQALRSQHDAEAKLGDLAGATIVLPAVRRLHGLLAQDSCFYPSGAGGGDVSLYVGPRPSSPEFRRAAKALQLFPVDLSFEAPGASTSQDKPL